MALLVPIIGADKTREYFLDKFLELCTSEIYDVRKMCAVFNPHLCKVLGVEVSEKQLVSKKISDFLLPNIRAEYTNWIY